MADRPIHLVLVDSDSIFRLGLQAALQAQVAVASVVVQPSLAIALEQLSPRPGHKTAVVLPDLVLLNLGSLVQDEGLGAVERSLRQFRQMLPELPMLGLEYVQPPRLGLWAQRMNLNGYWARGRSVPELVAAIEQVLRGQQVWTLAQGDAIAPAPEDRAVGWGMAARSSGQSPWSRMLNSGVQQIETRLRALERQRQSAQTPWIDQAWLAGWQRELRTTRWLLTQLGASALPPGPVESAWELENSSSVPVRSRLDGMEIERSPEVVLTAQDAIANPSLRPSLPSTSPLPPSPITNTTTANAQALQILLFDRIGQRIPPALLNITDEPLELDILNSAKRQELMSTVLRCFGELLLDVRLSNLEMDFLQDKRQELLLDLWQASLGDFLGRYSNLMLNGNVVDLLPILLQEQQNVERLMLNSIPDVSTVFGSLLFDQPVLIDGVAYRPESPEAIDRLVWLTENLLITVANAVVQPLLNHVAEVEVIRQSFYDKRLLSTREIERFRNNLSWKYRVTHWFREAQDIYESRYWLLGFGDRGIEKISVYATRRQELTSLTPLQQSVTLLLEVRDAVAPRLQFFTSWVGSGVVYVLTHVLGKGIGLIGLGIIQGVGSSIQEVRNLGKHNSGRKG